MSGAVSGISHGHAALSHSLLLAAVWTVGALELMMRPLYDLSRPIVGDVIIIIAGETRLSHPQASWCSRCCSSG